MLEAVKARRVQALGYAILAVILCAAFFGGRLLFFLAWTCGCGGAAFVSWYRMRNPVTYRNRGGLLGWFLNGSGYRKLPTERVVLRSTIEFAMFSVFAALGCLGILTAV